MNSRWSTNPSKRGGQVVAIRPNSAGDIKILKFLGTYGVATANMLVDLTGRSYGSIIARLNLLKREPVELIRVHPTQAQQPRFLQWSPQVFTLTPAGVAVLRDLGFEKIKKSSNHFIHNITQSQTAASFEVGARLAGLEHVVLDQPNLSVTFSYKGKDYKDHTIVQDGGPVGLGYGDDIYNFVVFETDCASEPLESSNRDRQAIETKLAAYLTVLENQLYQTVWGLPNLIILFTSTTQTRVNNMRALLHQMTDRYHNCFRFLCFPTILSGKAQLSTGWAVTETGLSRMEK